MVETLPAQRVDLRYLIETFGLQRVRGDRFFPEWQETLPELTDLEKQELDRIQAGYFNLIDYPPLLENAVKLAIVSPLLFVAGLYLSPLHLRAEQTVRLQAEDEGVSIEGRIDVLVLKQRLWVMVIEAKQVAFSLEEGLAQLLAYMLADPDATTPTFGMLTNGANFRFVKLARGAVPQYALSNQFVIDNQGNELYQVLQILKHLSASV